MVSNTFFTSELIIKDITSKEDILDALKELGAIDLDFIGENGEEYLWPEAKKEGFSTNVDYLSNLVVSSNPNKSVKEYAKDFAREWLLRDNYYQAIMIEVEKWNGKTDDPDISGTYAFSIVATYH